jgi:hypothetical protein
VTSVATYSNYQLISERGRGPGWVMVGDAFGFIDPMLSPGVFLALRSAELLADALGPWLERRAVPSRAELDGALASYSDQQSLMLTAWFELVAYLYEGGLARSWRPAACGEARSPGSLLAAEQYISRHGLLASGASTTSATPRYPLGRPRRDKTYAIR